jgi:hypothetical protein
MRQDRNSVSAGEISADLGVSVRIAARMIQRGEFGTPFNISIGESRMHWRVNRENYRLWLQRHHIQGKFWREKGSSTDNSNYVN